MQNSKLPIEMATNKNERVDTSKSNLYQIINCSEDRFHTRSRNKPGVEASPSSKLSIKSGKIMSTTSDLLTETVKSASKRITLSCTAGTPCFFST